MKMFRLSRDIVKKYRDKLKINFFIILIEIFQAPDSLFKKNISY